MAIYYAYSRVSTVQQNDTSIQVQEEFLKKEAYKLGMTIECYSEKESGKSVDGRPVFSMLLNKLKKGDVLGVYDNSRLSRNTQEALVIVNNLSSKGVFIQIGGKIIDSNNPTDELLFTVESAVSQYQRANQNLKAKLGTEKKRKNGDLVLRGDMLGYDISKKKGKVRATINPQEAKVVEFIFLKYIEGMSARTISKELEEIGHFHHPNKIKTIIQNTLYAGFYYEGEKFKSNIITSNVYPPIISEELFWKAQKRVADNSRETYNRRLSQHELSGLVECEECNAKYHFKKKCYFSSTHRTKCTYEYKQFDQNVYDRVFRFILYLTFQFGSEVGKFFEEKEVMLLSTSRDLELKKRELSSRKVLNAKKAEKLLEMVLEGLVDKEIVSEKLRGYTEDNAKIDRVIFGIEQELLKNNNELQEAYKDCSINVLEDFNHSVGVLRRNIYSKLLKATYDGRFMKVNFFNGKKYIIEKIPYRKEVSVSMSFKGERQLDFLVSFKENKFIILDKFADDDFGTYSRNFYSELLKDSLEFSQN